jgi:hypothetical protein
MRARDFYIPLETFKLRQAIKESMKKHIFEINFNDPKIISSALKTDKIQCGFEAETIWTNVSGEIDYDELSWAELEEMLGRRDVRQVEEAYNNWISENKTEEFMDDVLSDWISDNRGYYILDFVEDQDGFDEFKEENEDNEDYSNLGTKEWAERFIEENDLEGEFADWMSEKAHDEGEIWDQLYDRATQEYGIGDFIDDQYNSMSSFISDLGLTPDGSGGEGGLEEVSNLVEYWARSISSFSRVRAGGYHRAGGGTTQDYWRVEEDPSIDENEGKGAEIISPVYDSPEEMLEEIKSLFSFLKQNSVIVDDSTGLHVTMSWVGERNVKPNKLKMALLLGDEYLLQLFGRENNQYSKSQFRRIKDYANKIITNVSDQASLVALEQELGKAISSDKYNAINFKNLINLDNNPLLEFRIMGNEMYLDNFRDVEKTISRYAISMIAGHDPKSYVKDYVRALLRVIDANPQANSPASNIVDTTSGLKDIPIIKVAQQFSGKKTYSDIIDYLSLAYTLLNKAKSQRDAAKQPEMFTEDNNESDWQDTFKQARKSFVYALALFVTDIISKRNRTPITASIIMAVRKALNDFGLRYKDAWELIKETPTYKENQQSDVFTKQEQFINAFNSLVKTQAIQAGKPAFVIKYSDTDRVFLLKQAYDDYESITMRPAYFKVIDEVKVSQAKGAAETVNDLTVKIEQLTNQLDYHVKNNQDDNNYLAYQNELNDKIKYMKNKIEDAKQFLNDFKSKYNITVVKTGLYRYDFSPEYVTLSERDMKNLSDSHLIKFEEI